MRADSATVEQLVNMGFPDNRAKKAVFRTHNCGVEPAANWLMEHSTDADIDDPWEPASTSGRASSTEPVVGVPADVTTVINPGGDRSYAEPLGFSVECKAVLVVAANLLMTSGKIGSQCAHAAVGLYKVMMANRVPWYPAFEAQGEKIVVLTTAEGVDLATLADKASQLLLPSYLVSDAGRTQVLPGTVTVLGIAGPSETVDQITGNLQTLR